MNKNIDWEEVEQKIGLICYQFSNLERWHDDLAQELRLHAYYVSDNYYDLKRKAIDFWRKIQVHVMPEIPYFDLEILQRTVEDQYESESQYKKILDLINKELERPGENKSDNAMLEIAKMLMQIILSDIDPKFKMPDCIKDISGLNHYKNGRLNLTWVYEETGIGYKRIANAMRFLEDTLRGLYLMNKIELPEEYFKGYYK